MTFFHGRLKVHVIQAKDLPDMDTAFFNLVGKDLTDAFVIGDFGEARIFKTRSKNHHLQQKYDLLRLQRHRALLFRMLPPTLDSL